MTTAEDDARSAAAISAPLPSRPSEAPTRASKQNDLAAHQSEEIPGRAPTGPTVVDDQQRMNGAAGADKALASQPYRSPQLPLLRRRDLKAWPKDACGGKVTYVELGRLLAERYYSDAHYACYSAPSVERRLDVSLVRDPANADKIPNAGLLMVLASFDVDCQLSHKMIGARTPLPAPDSWWLDESVKLQLLLAEHPGGYVYRTRGGYRVVYVLADPFVIRSAVDDDGWKTQYLQWAAYLHRQFTIFADPSCADWTRLFRLPHSTRDGNVLPEDRETIGDPFNIGTWTCNLNVEHVALANTFRRQKAHRAKQGNALVPSPPSIGEGILFYAFQAREELGQKIESGKWSVACPWEEKHTKGTRFDSSTVLYAPNKTEGELFGWVHCAHAHCATLTLASVCDHFTKDEIAAARKAAGLPEVQPRTSEGHAPDLSAFPTIRIGLDLDRVIREATGALAKAGNTYSRGGALTRVVWDGKDNRIDRERGAPVIRPHTPATLEEELSTVARLRIPA